MKTILLVDDEFDMRTVFEMVFALEGYEVLCAADGEEALQKIAERKPDIILTDWMMPFMDGPELCRRVRASPDTKNIPIILLTAAPRELPSTNKLWDAMLTKPAKIDALLALAKDLISKQKSP